MKRMALLIILLLSSIFVGVVSAQEDTEDPNENACYAGGDLEGKCGVFETEEEIEWAWNCGHYYAQYIGGTISLEQAPDTCKLLFEKVEPFALCLYLGGGKTRAIEAGEYLLIEGAPNITGNSTHYLYGLGRNTSPCDELVPSGINTIWMQTPSFVTYDAALASCAEADPSAEWNDAFQLEDPDLSGFNWFCAELPR